MNLWEVNEVVRSKSGDPEESFAILYWSWGRDEAYAAWLDRCSDRVEISLAEAATIEVSIRRIDTLVVPLRPVPHYEDRRWVLRQCGWGCEDDVQCDGCGLYELDGLKPVCGACLHCVDCGCKCFRVPTRVHR